MPGCMLEVQEPLGVHIDGLGRMVLMCVVEVSEHGFAEHVRVVSAMRTATVMNSPIGPCC